MRPFISVLCPTYGRTALLSELVESFQRQTYDGRVELVILNDRSDQELQYQGSNPIRIINVTTRFETLGHKRNALVDLADGSHVCFWDDDDIYLGTHLEKLADLLDDIVPPVSGAAEAHQWQMRADGSVFIQGSGLLHSLLIKKTTIEAVGGFPLTAQLQDVGLVQKLVRARLFPNIYGGRAATMPSTLYRAAGIDTAHVGDFSATEAHDGFVEAESQFSEPTGRIVLVPEWRENYEAKLRKAWDDYIRQ